MVKPKKYVVLVIHQLRSRGAKALSIITHVKSFNCFLIFLHKSGRVISLYSKISIIFYTTMSVRPLFCILVCRLVLLYGSLWCCLLRHHSFNRIYEVMPYFLFEFFHNSDTIELFSSDMVKS